MYHSNGYRSNSSSTQKCNVSTLLNAFPFTSKCNQEQRASLVDACSCVYFKRGQTLIWEGNRCTEALLIANGRVRVYLIGPNGREVQLYRLEDGAACASNLLSVVNRSECMVHVVAESDVMALRITTDDFHTLLQINSCFHTYVMEEINAGLSSLIGVTKTLAFVRVEQRVTDYLISRCKQSGANRVIHTTHADIAAEIGTAREVVSRILKQFEKAGIINVSRGKIVVNALKEEPA